MNEPPLPIEEWVRAHLEQQERTVDAEQVLAGVRERLASAASSPPARPKAAGGGNGRRWFLATSTLLAAAAVLLFVFLGTGHIGPARASAADLVRAAQKAHAEPIDRCYQVVGQPTPDMRDRFPLLPPHIETRLWTRGNLFWMESTPREARQGKWAWGRDREGRVWLAPTTRAGLRFDPDEVPEPLGVACDICSMRPETLLDDVLRDFDLAWEQSEREDTQVVRAHLKEGHAHPDLKALTLEMDAATKVLRRVVLERTIRGMHLATVTYTLIETREQPSEWYTLEGHLDSGSPIYTRQHFPLIRGKLFLHWTATTFGPRFRP